jgi:integrase
MPIKLIPPRKGFSSNWRVRGTYLRQYVDRSTGTSDRAIAVKIIKDIERQIELGEFAKTSGPTFASVAVSYMKAGGERTYFKSLLEHFGETPITQIDQAAIDAAAAALYPNASPATRNRSVYTPVSAALRHAGVVIALKRPKGSGGKKATSWLWPEQAFSLFAEAERINVEFAALLVFLCYTGLRLSEALQVKWNDVRLEEAFAYVPDTKNGEARPVFLPGPVVEWFTRIKQDRERVFRFAKGGHIYSLLTAAAAKAEVTLPERSAFHLFRHTYATWMRRFGRLDTRGLIGTGTWKNRKSVERYEHVEVTEEAMKANLLPVPPSKKTRDVP